jgi:5'(3')-deoxyribonucleotidase
VPEGWGIERHNCGYMVNPPHGPGRWVSDRDDFNVPLADQTLAKLCASMLAANPAPDHSAGVGGVVSSRKRRVFVDMDGVIVDFDAYKIANNMTGDEVKRTPGAYLAMPAIPGAIEAVRSVIGMGFDVWIATKPPTGVPYAYSDKAAWIMEHLPELKRKIIITHDKGLLGDARDFLCDDRPRKANCERFAGSLLRFVDGYHWPQALDDLRAALAQPADAG